MSEVAWSENKPIIRVDFENVKEVNDNLVDNFLENVVKINFFVVTLKDEVVVA